MTVTWSRATLFRTITANYRGHTHTHGIGKHTELVPHSGSTAHGSHGPGPQYERSPPGPVPAL